jgi:hypothetical protein
MSYHGMTPHDRERDALLERGYIFNPKPIVKLRSINPTMPDPYRALHILERALHRVESARPMKHPRLDKVGRKPITPIRS